MSWICKQGNDKAGALTAIAGRGSPVAWHACEMFYFALMTLMHPRHFLISQSATFRSKNSVDAAFLTKWNITNLNQNWVRGEDYSCNCYVKVTPICSYVPSLSLSQEKEKWDVAFALGENLEWIPQWYVDMEIFLFKETCPTSWIICSSNLVAVKPSFSHLLCI